MELPQVADSFAVSAEEAEKITLMLEKQFAARFTEQDKGALIEEMADIGKVNDPLWLRLETGELTGVGESDAVFITNTMYFLTRDRFRQSHEYGPV